VHIDSCERAYPYSTHFFSINLLLKVKACRGYALTGGQGDSKDVGPLLENVANEDKRSAVCDPTLAHRQAIGMSSLGHPLHVAAAAPSSSSHVPLTPAVKAPSSSPNRGGEGIFFHWRSHPDQALWALVEQSKGALRGDCGAWYVRKHGGSGDGVGEGRGGKWPFAKLDDGCGLECTKPGKVESFVWAELPFFNLLFFNTPKPIHLIFLSSLPA